MADDDYEIIAHSEIERLKQEIEMLKMGHNPKGANVTDRLDEMLDIFREASHNMQNEPPLGETLTDIQEKLATLLDQNQKIAEGIVALADLVQEQQITKPDEVSKSVGPSPMEQPKPVEPLMTDGPRMPPPGMPPRQSMPRQPSMSPPSHDMDRGMPKPPSMGSHMEPLHTDMPPLPPIPPKKKGMFR